MPAALPYMPFFVADYLGDTAHLSTLEHGAYCLLIFHYWNTGALPADAERLRRIAGLSKGNWKKTAPILKNFFLEKDGFWVHKRIETELEKARAKSMKARAAGTQSGVVRRNVLPAESGNGRSPGVEPHANYPDPDKKKMTDDAREIVEMFEAATGRRATDADRETAARLVGFPPDKIRDGIRKSVERSSEPVGSLKYCEMAIRRLAKPSRRTEPRPEAPCPVVAAEPLEPRGRFSDEQKAPVFDAARTFIYRFAAMGNTPSREAIRSHLVEWAIEGGHPLELVDEVYPPAAEAAG